MDPIQSFADLFGTPRPAATFLLASFSFVPIAWLHRFISSPSLRHLYCTVTGLLLSVFVFGWTADAHFFVCTLYSMAIMRLFRRKCGVLTFFGTFAYLIGCHVIMRTHETRTEGVLDCTGALTVLATKLSAVAYNYQDGLTLLKEKDEGAQAKDENERKELTEEQRRREERMERSRLERRKTALVTMPSVLELMGYLFCSGLRITGPFFEFKVPSDLHAETAVPPSAILPCIPSWHHLHTRASPLCTFPSTPLLTTWRSAPQVSSSHLSSRPFSTRSSLTSLFCPLPSIPPLHIWFPGFKQAPILPPFFRAFTQGVLAATVFLLVSPSLDLTRISDLRKNRSFPFHLRWLYAHHAGIVWRFRAYILWSITEAAMIVGRLGFSGWEAPNGETGKGGDVKGNGGKSEGGKGNGKGGGDGDAGKHEGDKTCAAPAGEGKALWNRARNADILGVEFPKSCLDFATTWNISYGLWLRLYVYERMVPPGRRPTFVHMLTTMLVSAVSHGLNWGDFIFFANWALVVASSKAIYQLSAGIAKGTNTHRIVTLLHTLYSIFVCSYLASAFCVMTLSGAYSAYSGMYYTGTVIPILLIFLPMVYKPRRPKTFKTL
ncbi:unnamed protein product [Closterium sp. Yama58-4]|nr:unnamed protein product [Closterium sp. Yama58-4]